MASYSARECIAFGIPERGIAPITICRYDLRPVSRPAWKGEEVDTASRAGRYCRRAVITRTRSSGSPNPAWTCMPPTKNCRTLCWNLISNSW